MISGGRHPGVRTDLFSEISSPLLTGLNLHLRLQAREDHFTTTTAENEPHLAELSLDLLRSIRLLLIAHKFGIDL